MKIFFKKVTIILSLLLLVSTIFAPGANARALDNHLGQEEFVAEVYDEELNDTIKIYLLYAENGKSRVQGINSKKELVYDYSFDLKDNNMTSNLTGEVVEIESPKIDSQKINSTEPNYCSGSSYQNVSYTVAQISAAMAGTVTLSAISAYLVGLLSASAGFSVSYSAVRTAASAVFLSITSGDFNKRVSFRINFTCSRMWESDPFHPSGGFYFYGWRLSNVTYLGLY